MRIAVMADIHSNHIALEARIAEAKQRHAEEFLFLGDYLGELAYPEKTLELLGWIRSQFPCGFIRGNKEEYWINHKNGKHGDWVWESGKELFRKWMRKNCQNKHLDGTVSQQM